MSSAVSARNRKRLIRLCGIALTGSAKEKLHAPPQSEAFPRRQLVRRLRPERLVATSLVVTVAVLWSYVTWSELYGPLFADVDAYWDAALRLRNGEPLYPDFPD